MGRSIPKNVQDAFYRVIHDYPEGVEALANKMGIPTGTLYNKANTNESSHHKPTLADAVVATVISGDKRILHAFAATVGEACYSLPDLSNLSTTALVSHITRTEAVSGDFYRAIHQALETDGLISSNEFEVIKRQAYGWISVILEGLERMKEMSQ
ncbi:phage regulatory CII family protein [Nitrosospira sp. Nsp1]|uniref:phage regulatory CII family protein n=1 Tax=Nitrosospira sp. Nsp1 TaxID=136547 RepID=UPI000891514B|nr:phage regulatory CII family protein [Nitrosospira sp. Nsp1]SCX40542.1 Phage regulatory protein CII (CP76) [Nitrosospira sp. Nsp1]